MSSDETTLNDFAGGPDAETARGPEIVEGARYARERSEWTGTSEKTHVCLNCGTDVIELANTTETVCQSEQQAREICRVVGDENDCVKRCPACTDYARLSVAARKGISIETGGVSLKGAILGGEL